MPWPFWSTWKECIPCGHGWLLGSKGNKMEPRFLTRHSHALMGNDLCRQISHSNLRQHHRCFKPCTLALDASKRGLFAFWERINYLQMSVFGKPEGKTEPFVGGSLFFDTHTHMHIPLSLRGLLWGFVHPLKGLWLAPSQLPLESARCFPPKHTFNRRN